jgi:uncharacterized protein YjiS (DUF1127 family)
MEMHMTSVNNSHTQPGVARNLAFLATPVKWLQRIRERRELLALLSQPDYILKDIGLQRDEISREALKRFWMN